MKDVRELQVAQVRLLPAHAIQLDQFAAPTVREALAAKFRFRSAGLDSLVPPLSFGGILPLIPMQDGEFTDQEGQRVVIKSLVIESRRVVTQVAGTSQQANAFYDEFTTVLRDIVSSMSVSLSNIVYKAEETACVVTLDFDFAKLFRPRVVTFLRKQFAAIASEPGVKALVEPMRFTSIIRYEVKDKRINKHGITLNPKELVIEPRAGVPLAEHTYYTKSPLPSDQHLQLLKEFEDSIR